MIHNENILNAILQVMKRCDIRSFPVDCFELIKEFGYSIKKYSELPEKKRIACNELSEDAATLKNTIFYNDDMPHSRIRFSLLHELGHIVLSTEDEVSANTFASHLLAPRIVIHYSNCKNVVDVMKIFDLSEQAANYAFEDYRRWHRENVIKGMNETDQKLYDHFYNSNLELFVWKIQKCDFCYNEYVYNKEGICNTCRLFDIRKRYTPTISHDIREHDLDILRGNYLYGEH